MPKWTHADAVRKITSELATATAEVKRLQGELLGERNLVCLLSASLKQADDEAEKAKASLEMLRNLIDDITETDVFDADLSIGIIMDACRTAQKDWTYATAT
jgi:chromosome segregation ATPase